MKFKRVLGATLLGSAALAGFASCGGTKNSSTDIVFYHTMGDSLQAVLNTAIAKFEAENEGWTIQSTQIGGYDDVKAAVIADLQAGTQPDLAYCYADHVAEYLTTNKVLDLYQFINDPVAGYTAEEIADFVPGYYNEGTQFVQTGSEVKMYTLPYSKSTEVVYVNKDAITELGLTDKVKADWTWDEFWDICRAIKANSTFKSWIPMGYDSEANWFITYCEQAGIPYTSATGENYLFNNAEAKAWLTELKDLYAEGLFTTQTVYGSYTSNLFIGAKKDATTGKFTSTQACVFSIGSTGGASHQDPGNAFEYEVLPLPRVAGKDLKCISQGPSLVMLDQGDSEKHLMTWKFVKMLLEPEYQAEFSAVSGYMPVRQSSLELPYYAEWLNGTGIIPLTSKTAATLADSYFASPAFRGSSDARIQVGAALTYAISGTKTVEKALQDAYDECSF